MIAPIETQRDLTIHGIPERLWDELNSVAAETGTNINKLCLLALAAKFLGEVYDPYGDGGGEQREGA